MKEEEAMMGKMAMGEREFEMPTYCVCCGKRLFGEKSIPHHINYKDDITVIVCRSCHAKIHHSTTYFPHLKPVDKKVLSVWDKEMTDKVFWKGYQKSNNKREYLRR